MVFYSLIIGGLAHLLFDSILDSNPSNGIGIAIFFPFSSNVYSPFNLISQSYFTNEWNIKEGKFASSILSTLIEIPFWIIAGYFEISKKYK